MKTATGAGQWAWSLAAVADFMNIYVQPTTARVKVDRHLKSNCPVKK